MNWPLGVATHFYSYIKTLGFHYAQQLVWPEFLLYCNHQNPIKAIYLCTYKIIFEKTMKGFVVATIYLNKVAYS